MFISLISTTVHSCKVSVVLSSKKVATWSKSKCALGPRCLSIYLSFRFIKLHWEKKNERIKSMWLQIFVIFHAVKSQIVHLMHLSINVKPLGWGGGGERPGIGGGFDSSHCPIVGTSDCFNSFCSNVLLTFSYYFDNPQMPWGGHLNRNSQLRSNARPPPPSQWLTIDRCIRCTI